MKNKISKILNRNYHNEHQINIEYSYLKECKKILDAGCGEGEFIKKDPKKIEGIDDNPETVRLCKKLKLKVKKGDVTKLPYSAKSFDGIVCSHVIEHLTPEKVHKTLTELSRVLKKNGILVISTPLLWNGFYSDLSHIRPYNPECIERYLIHNGRQKTLNSISSQFKKINLVYRYELLPIPGRVGKVISSILYKFKIHSYKRNGYTLVLKKVN